MATPSDARQPILTPEIGAYIDGLSETPSPLEAALKAHALANNFPLIGQTSGRWIELLARSIKAQRVFEFGSGFGFSAFYFARAVGEDGEVIGSEYDPDVHAHFSDIYGDDPLAKRIDIRVGDAIEIFGATQGQFDVVLLDIDKEGYVDALQAALPRVRPGGLILADNVLWGGRTATEAEAGDTATAALREFNAMLYADSRVQTGILPTGDGLSVSLVL